MTMADVIALVTKLNEQNQQTIVSAIKEARKPTDYEQAKIDKEQAKEKLKLEARIAGAQAEVTKRKNRMLNCPHSSQHPLSATANHTWVGQVHGDQKKFFVPTCQQCTTQLPKIYCSQEQVQEGIGLQRYKGIDINFLLTWAEKSGNAEEVAQFRTQYSRAA